MTHGSYLEPMKKKKPSKEFDSEALKRKKKDKNNYSENRKNKRNYESLDSDE